MRSNRETFFFRQIWINIKHLYTNRYILRQELQHMSTQIQHQHERSISIFLVNLLYFLCINSLPATSLPLSLFLSSSFYLRISVFSVSFVNRLHFTCIRLNVLECLFFVKKKYIRSISFSLCLTTTYKKCAKWMLNCIYELIWVNERASERC